MNKEQKKRYAEQLKQSAKELLDGIGTDTDTEQRIIALIYACVHSGLMESRAGKVGSG